MFAVHVSNPFTASSREEQRNLDVLEKHALERAQREESRREGFQTDQRMQKTFKDLSKQDPNDVSTMKSSLAERAKFQFEADSEDDELENEVGYNPFVPAGDIGFVADESTDRFQPERSRSGRGTT